MHYSFSDGTVLDVPDMCGYCQMTTGGAHQPNCPLYQPPVQRETYPEFVKRKQRQIDEHPEWGIKYL